jgi:hypothetical protein
LSTTAREASHHPDKITMLKGWIFASVLVLATVQEIVAVYLQEFSFPAFLIA